MGLVVAHPSAQQYPVTLLDIKNHLFSHFQHQSTFNLKVDLDRVRVAEKDGHPLEPYKEALYRAALDDMERAGFVLSVDRANGCYVLTQPITMFNQQVIITPATAELVASMIQICGDMVGHDYTPNKMALTDADIAAIGQICAALMSQLDDVYNEGPNGGQQGPADPEAN